MKRNDARKPTIELIGPENVDRYLELNSYNRPPLDSVVDRYALDMCEGRWADNGATLTLSTDPKTNREVLVDGQHRLRAVKKSGVTIAFVVVRGAAWESSETTDIGRTRLLRDVLAMEHLEYASVLSTAGRYHLYWLTYGTFDRNRKALTNPAVLASLRRTPELRTYVNAYGKARTPLGLSNAMLAVLHYLFAQRHTEQAEAFMEALVMGTDGKPGNPAWAARNWILTNRKKHSVRFTAEAAHVAINAWCKCRKGEPLTLAKRCMAQPIL